MQEQLLLSIIVPVYNVEKVLRKCVESLEKQDMSHDRYEVILVNDGSTDRSGAICHELAALYENIQVIEQENQGLSMARNAGLDIARAKYLMFIDSDDYIEPNSISRVVEVAEHNRTELCFYLLESFNEHSKWQPIHQPFEYYKVYTGEYILTHGMNIFSSCTNLYLTDFLRKAGVRFHKGLINEDIDFNMRLYPLAHSILFTDILVYHYNCSYSYSSTTRNKDVAKHRKTLLSAIEIANDIFHYCESVPVSEGIKRLYHRRMRSLLVSSILQIFKERQYYDRSFLHSFLDKANSYHLYPIWGRTESWKTTIILPFINLLRITLGRKVKK